MKKISVVVVLGIVAILIFAISGCGKVEKTVEEPETSVTETVNFSKIISEFESGKEYDNENDSKIEELEKLLNFNLYSTYSKIEKTGDREYEAEYGSHRIFIEDENLSKISMIGDVTVSEVALLDEEAIDEDDMWGHVPESLAKRGHQYSWTGELIIHYEGITLVIV